VKAYRLEWEKRMMVYKLSMEDYSGEDEATVIPRINNDLKMVMVTHDESTFYAHDGKETVWLLGNEHPILKKGQGQSIMVSEFQCPVMERCVLVTRPPGCSSMLVRIAMGIGQVLIW
jgi:hypothetical protein